VLSSENVRLWNKDPRIPRRDNDSLSEGVIWNVTRMLLFLRATRGTTTQVFDLSTRGIFTRGSWIGSTEIHVEELGAEKRMDETCSQWIQERDGESVKEKAPVRTVNSGSWMISFERAFCASYAHCSWNSPGSHSQRVIKPHGDNPTAEYCASLR
jgi:hypothetical protein